MKKQLRNLSNVSPVTRAKDSKKLYHARSIECWRLLEHENAQGCKRSCQKNLSQVIVFLLGVCIIQSSKRHRSVLPPLASCSAKTKHFDSLQLAETNTRCNLITNFLNQLEEENKGALMAAHVYQQQQGFVYRKQRRNQPEFEEIADRKRD
jgi:hypothetical protein